MYRYMVIMIHAIYMRMEIEFTRTQGHECIFLGAGRQMCGGDNGRDDYPNK
jgi:hypothetical protein